MMWLSQGAPREITGGPGRNVRVPQRGTDNTVRRREQQNSHKEVRTSRDRQGHQLPPIYGLNVLPVNSWDIRHAGQIVRDQELQRSMRDRNAHIENVHLPKD